MKLCVAILDVGTLPYASISRKVLEDYFTRKQIDYKFITSSILDSIDINTKKAHPSWWKMIIHRLLPGYDYIICWDLDLLPKSRDVSILEMFDFTKLTLAYDSPGNTVPFCPDFKYNGGLIGIPASHASFTEYIYDTYAPGTLPSYEQYYLNTEIARKEIKVHELPRNVNVLYPVKKEERPAFYDSLVQHYTYGFGTEENRVSLIQAHHDRYFQGTNEVLFNTRDDMVTSLINEQGTYAEIGVFKGEFSKFLFHTLNPKHLALFDIFEGYCGSGDVNGNNMSFVYLQHEYVKLLEYFHETNVKLYKGDSKQLLLENYPDDFFDMIYIDAEHTYESVKSDLIQAYSKIKDKGFIMGHDYDVNPLKTDKAYDYTGVRKAVQEFCDMYTQKIFAKALDGCISFCIYVSKPTH